MPLFTFKCVKCSKIIEKFLKDEKAKIACDCGSKEVERQFGLVSSSRIWRGAQEHLDNVINPEVDRIQKELSKGDDNTFIDVVGDE
jgi:putative FmdB family regulatory protein